MWKDYIKRKKSATHRSARLRLFSQVTVDLFHLCSPFRARPSGTSTSAAWVSERRKSCTGQLHILITIGVGLLALTQPVRGFPRWNRQPLVDGFRQCSDQSKSCVPGQVSIHIENVVYD